MEPRKYAEVAELADAQDLKSCETYTFVPVRFRSSAPYLLNIAEWSSWQLVGLITRRSQVQVLSPQPFKYYGSLVKRSRHRPFTAVTGVRFPYESPCGCSSMVEFRPSKPAVRVRSPSPAPFNYPGTIAQLGEHLPYKQGVTGSSPVGPTIKIYAGIVQR